MSEGTVMEMAPEQKVVREPKLIIGLVPCFNRLFLDTVWPVIRPSVEELASMCQGEWKFHKIWTDTFGGAMHLYMAYMDRTGMATNEKFQEYFVNKLSKPTEDYVGWFAVQLFQDTAHVFAAYVHPNYRNTNVWNLGYDFVEAEVKRIGLPYISAAMPRNRVALMEKKGFTEVMTYLRKKL